MAPSTTKREKAAKTSKACKAMKQFGISAETVKEALKGLLQIYEGNWMYIEEDDYKMLLDTILEPEGPKKKDIVIHGLNLRDESDEEEEIEPLKKKARVISPASTSSPAGTSVPYSTPVVYLLENDSSPQSSVEGDRFLAIEYKNLDSNENENVNVNESQFPSDIDIASSSNGEVKLVISICKLPQGFRIPSFDAVKKQVEDKYRKAFQGFGNEFSVSELLNDICASFMEHGNASDANNQTLVPVFDNLKEPDKQFDPSNDPVQIPKFVVSSEFTNFPCVGFSSSDRNQQQMIAINELSGSSCLSIIPSVEICSSSHYFVADITRGLEKQKISLINEFNDEILPAFTYIQTSFSFKTANVKFMLARISDENCCSNCFGNCLSPEVRCACAAETVGDFAYTYDGTIKKEFLESSIAVTRNPKTVNYFYCETCPLERLKNTTRSSSCKGHLVRKFIKECWYKCECGLYCGNRVVQRGIKAKLQVFMTSEGKGWGLRTLEDLPKGKFVCEYVGEIVTNSELFQRNEENKDVKHSYPVLLDAGWSSEGFLTDEETLFLDATSYGNVARFINHRCEDANMVDIPVEVESPDHHYHHHGFFTTREVKAMEELSRDYGIDFDDDSHPMKCKCRSKFCKANKYKRRSKRMKQEASD